VNGSDIHQRTAESFSAFLDGELDPQARQRVEDHLASCIQCRVSLDRFRRTVGGLTQLRRPLPGEFLANIQDQINRRSRGRFFSRKNSLFGRIPFEWISLAMIIAMLVYYIVVLQTSPTGVVPAQ
jgi:anti-sigma factor RsiW